MTQKHGLRLMSLCIAAVANHESEPRIILCSDWQQETRIAGAEIGDKLRWIEEYSWAALIADSAARAQQIVDAFREHFKQKQTELSHATISRIASEALAKYKLRICDEYFGSHFGFTYEDLLKNGLSGAPFNFPESFVSQQLANIECLPFHGQVIVAGFLERKPILFVLNEDPSDPAAVRVRFDSNFTAIGSGAPVAITTLYRRKHEGPEIAFMQAIYHVYEAMVLSGEISPGVGKETMSIDILRPDAAPQSLTDEGYSYLEKRFTQFGPRPIEPQNRFTLADRYFELFETDWPDPQKRRESIP